MASAFTVRKFLIAFAAVLVLGLPVSVHAALSDADGTGEVTVTPEMVETGATDLSFEFDFEQTTNYPILQRLLRSFLLPGSRLEITVPAEWTKPQLTDVDAPGYVFVEQGEGGGPLHVNTCNFTYLDVSVTPGETGPWTITIPQHCGYHDHLIITYDGVTAPASAVYEFTSSTRAGLTGTHEIVESPEVTVTLDCEDGFHPGGEDNLSCVPNDPPFCPDGFHPGEGGYCQQDTPIVTPNICPSGTTYSAETGQCEGANVPPNPCPEGLIYDPDENICTDQTLTPPTYCPDGYSLIEGMCTTEGDSFPPTCGLPEVPRGLDMCGLPPESPVCMIGELNPATDMCVVDDTEPFCPEHFLLTTPGEGAPMCVFVEFEPSCEEGFHLNEDRTACLVNESIQQDSDGGNGGGGTTHHPWERAEADDDGEVLGAETGPDDSCTPLLTDYMSEKRTNNPDQVKALQGFLNGELSLTLEVNGVYGPETTQAVRDFQLKYWQDVLAPWVPFGLPTDHTSTGNVFKLTEWKINNIHCGSDTPAPAIP